VDGSQDHRTDTSGNHSEQKRVLSTDKKKPLVYKGFFYLLADQAGFEPAEGLTPRTLSRRVT
jgi:hypothetical protein